MKKNIFLLVASAALLASCGATSTVAAAPTDKGEANETQVNELLTKSTSAVKEADGLTVEFGADISVKASVPGAVLGLEKDLTESIKLSNFSLKGAAGVKDNRLVEAASLSGSLSANLDLPKASDVAVSIEHKDLSFGLSAKEWVSEDKVYLDGTGSFDAVQKIAEIAGSFGADVSAVPQKAEDLKGYIALEAGFCSQGATTLSSILPVAPALVATAFGSQAQFHNFSDGSIGLTFTLPETVDFISNTFGVDTPEIVTTIAEALEGKFVVTISEKGGFAAYLDAKGSVELPLAPGAVVTVDVDAKCSAAIQLGKVNVEAVPNPDSFQPLNVK